MVDPIQEYHDSPTILAQLPLKAETFDFTLTEVHGTCPQCDSALVHLRGKIVDYGNCLEVRSSGICPQHKMLVVMRAFRYYADGHVMFKDHGEWVQAEKRGVVADFLASLWAKLWRRS